MQNGSIHVSSPPSFLLLNAIYFRDLEEMLQHLLILTSFDLYQPLPHALWKSSSCEIANKKCYQFSQGSWINDQMLRQQTKLPGSSQAYVRLWQSSHFSHSPTELNSGHQGSFINLFTLNRYISFITRSLSLGFSLVIRETGFSLVTRETEKKKCLSLSYKSKCYADTLKI